MAMHNLTEGTELQSTDTSQDIKVEPSHIRYRDWIITTKLINGQLWVRWQHPAESFPRYNYPVRDKGLAETIRYVRLLIDMATKLEQDAEKHATLRQHSLESFDCFAE